MVTFSA
jgi:glycerophosphoryl diester phosphodiesterase